MTMVLTVRITTKLSDKVLHLLVGDSIGIDDITGEEVVRFALLESKDLPLKTGLSPACN